jgi:hypothetical protein
MFQHIGLIEDIKESQAYLQQIVDFNNKFPDYVDQYLDTLASAVTNLVEYGWYLPWLDRVKLRDLKDIIKLYKANSQNDIDNFLCDFFERRLDEIQEEITQRFPLRKDPLTQAFTAHKNKQYCLSTPVFLTQADGIFVDLTSLKKGPYQRDKQVPMTQVWVNSLMLDDFTKAYLDHLNRTSTLILNKTERLTQPINKGINRHTILHGESTNYGDRVNSLKALSFLYFVKTTVESATKLPPLT